MNDKEHDAVALREDHGLHRTGKLNRQVVSETEEFGVGS